jgi:hypothetical protein
MASLREAEPAALRRPKTKLRRSARFVGLFLRHDGDTVYDGTMSSPVLDPAAGSAQWFATTHWSVVLAAKQSDSSQSAAALEKLCRAYWRPLYAYIRRDGELLREEIARKRSRKRFDISARYWAGHAADPGVPLFSSELSVVFRPV